MQRIPSMVFWGMSILLLCTGLAAVGRASGQEARQIPEQNISKEEARLLAEANQYFSDQDWAKAASLYQAVLDKNPKIGSAWHHLGYCLHVLGKLDEAIVAHQKASEFPRFRNLGLYNLACAYALKKDKDKAFAYLEKAIEAGFQSKQFLETDSDLDLLRNDERFAELIKKTLKVTLAEASQQLDFWIGEWEVSSQQGTKLGTSLVAKKDKGKAISETWLATGGSSGTSLLYFDPSEKKWHLVCVMDQGEIFRGSGSIQERTLSMEGDHIRGDGSKGRFKLTLLRQDQDKIRYSIEVSSDDGKTWRLAHDAVYVRKANS